jgi:Ca2+-binding RTX toxin-like protein
MLRRLLVLAALLAFAVPASAGAATVRVLPDTSNAIEFKSVDATTVNTLTIAPTATAGTYRVVDTSDTITVIDQGCVQIDAHTADCTTFADNDPIRQVVVELGGGDDFFSNDAALSCICHGQGDDDVMTGSNAEAERDQLFGGPGTDTLTGRGGSDSLHGDEGNDDILGNAGQDALEGGAGDDTLDGGAEDDRAVYRFSDLAVEVDLPESGPTPTTGQGAAGENDSLLSIENAEGSFHDDVLTGNSATNILEGGGGTDTLNGQGGFDVLSGGDGGDFLNGGPGDDFLTGGAGNDSLFGEGDDDRLQGDDDFDFPGLPPVLDERGNDVLDGGPGIDSAAYVHRRSAVTVVLPDIGQSSGNGDTGSAEDDKISATVEDVSGGQAGDTLTGNGQPNVLDGGDGDDVLTGGAGNDHLWGGNHADTLHGGTEGDVLQGDAQFTSDPGSDILNGDAGSDQLEGWGGGDTLNGGPDSDLLQGGPGADTLRGDAGTDTLKGDANPDDLGGGADADTVAYSHMPAGVKVRLAGATATTGNGLSGGAEDDTIQPDVENLVGSDFSDDLGGGSGPNVINARGGNDTVDVVGGGADTVDCGSENDVATGDAGVDTLTNCENGGGGNTGDSTPPNPTIKAPAGLTSESAFYIDGTASTAAGDLPGILVRVFAGTARSGEPLLTLETNADLSAGTWFASRSTPLSAGTYTADATQHDASGNGAHSEPVTFTVSGPATAEPTATPTATPVSPARPGLAPAPTVGPKVDGAPKVGSIITADVGGWVNGVFQFKVSWRVCDADGRSNCAPTKDSESFSHRVDRKESGRTFLFAVTASNSHGSTTRVSPPTKPAAAPPKMPDVTRKPMITVKKAGTLLRDAGICTESDPARCADRMPVNLRLDGVARDEVPKDLRRTIENGEIFAQKPADGAALAQGDRVKLSFYSAKADKPTPCAYFNYSEARVKKEFGGKPFSEVREKLVDGQCEHGWAVVAKDSKLAESKVSDAKVDFNTLGSRFIQLLLIEPEPVNYKPVPRIDTDGDGIWDEWESKGVDANSDGTIDLDLPAMGADPRHKDLFVELDQMESHPFSLDAVNDVVAAFAAGNISNPDGKTGVTLHLDAGKDAVMNPKTGAKWGARSNANELPHADKLGTMDGKTYNWTAFQDLKTANFQPARAAVFRYAINMHNHPKPGVTGTARGIPGEPSLAGPSDLVVGGKNPCAAPDHCLLTRTEQAVNLMHEIGHLLGLGHGGRDSAGTPNHQNGKPNYLSIMNYSWSFTGVKIGESFKIDFSPFPGSDEAADRLTGRPGTVAPLDENALSELGAIRASGAAAGYSVAMPCPAKPKTFATLNGAIDWDCIDGVKPAAVKRDLNGDGATTVLRSNDDWANMTFTGGSIGDFNMVLPTQEKHVVDEPTYEQQQEAAAAAHGDEKAPTVRVKRTGRRLKVTAADDKRLAQVTVQIDRGTPKVYLGSGPKLAKTVKLPKGRHRVLIGAVDVAGNRSKPKRVRSR